MWLTDPDLYAPVSDILPEGKFLVYDCMDDALEFPRRKTNRSLYEKIFDLEKRLCERSDLILITSDHLKQVIVERHKIGPDKISLVSNAMSLEEERPDAGPAYDHVLEKISKRTGPHKNLWAKILVQQGFEALFTGYSRPPGPRNWAS